MFQFPGLAWSFDHIIADGLPHSEIRGSMVICTSPRLFAAYHVLLRLREPRHPPYALCYFLVFFLRTVWVDFILGLSFARFLSFFQYVKDLLCGE